VTLLEAVLTTRSHHRENESFAGPLLFPLPQSKMTSYKVRCCDFELFSLIIYSPALAAIPRKKMGFSLLGQTHGIKSNPTQNLNPVQKAYNLGARLRHLLPETWRD